MIESFRPLVLFFFPIAPFVFCPLVPQNRPQRGDFAHFEPLV